MRMRKKFRRELFRSPGGRVGIKPTRGGQPRQMAFNGHVVSRKGNPVSHKGHVARSPSPVGRVGIEPTRGGPPRHMAFNGHVVGRKGHPVGHKGHVSRSPSPVGRVGIKFTRGGSTPPLGLLSSC